MGDKREYVYISQGCIDARDINFKMPETVDRCFACHGNGRRVQRYIEGTMSGECDWCDGAGFRYRGDPKCSRGVPDSVINQIAVASGVTFRRFQAHGLDWR